MPARRVPPPRRPPGVRGNAFVRGTVSRLAPLDASVVGSVATPLMHAVDWFPTVIRLAGVTPQPGQCVGVRLSRPRLPSSDVVLGPGPGFGDCSGLATHYALFLGVAGAVVCACLRNVFGVRATV